MKILAMSDDTKITFGKRGSGMWVAYYSTSKFEGFEGELVPIDLEFSIEAYDSGRATDYSIYLDMPEHNVDEQIYGMNQDAIDSEVEEAFNSWLASKKR
jgi:hypothetical protein